MKNSDRCPVCGEYFTIQCKCPLMDRQCHRGHEWRLCPVHEKVVIGKGDHGKSTLICHCEDKEDH